MKLFIIGNPNSVHIQRWVRYFEPKHDVHLLGIRPPTKDIPQGITFHDLTQITYIPKIRYAVWALAVRRLISRYKPDIVHAHWISGAGWIGAATGFHPFLVTAHGSDLMILARQSRIHRRLTGWVLNKADYVVCVSQKLYDEVLEFGLSSDKSEIVMLGVDTNTFKPAPYKARTRSEFIDWQPTVLSIRAMTSIYNPLDIAQVIPMVHDHVPEAKFVILVYNADVDVLAQFKKSARKYEELGLVEYVYEVDDEKTLAGYYQSADIAVSIASSDGTPISVQEAMACGTPLVLGDIPAFHSWVRNEKEALLVPEHDSKALSEAIIRLLRDQELRKLISQNGQHFIHENADSNKWMRRSEEIYRQLTGETG